MTGERIARLEAQLEAQAASMADLKREMERDRQERREADQLLFRKIDELTVLANRGKGALSVLVAAGGCGRELHGRGYPHLRDGRECRWLRGGD